MSVARIEAAVRSGDPARALNAALIAWGETRATELADLVDVFGARARVTLAPRAGAKLHAWWLERALVGVPAELDQLLELIGKRPTQNDSSWQSVVRGIGELSHEHPIVAPIADCLTGLSYLAKTNMLERIVALLCAPDDPRLTALFARWVIAAPYRWGSFDDAGATRTLTLAIYGALVARLAELRDARCIDALRACLAAPRAPTQTLRAFQTERLPALIATLEGTRTPLSDADRRAIVALLPGSAPPLATEAAPAMEPELWRQIAASPEDDGRREVLADWLQARGDTRGEFIQLQLAASRDAKLGARAAKLLRARWAEWLGDLALVLNRSGTTFDRGALDVVRVGLQRTPDWAWDKIRGHPMLSCVRRVVEGYVQPAQLLRCLADPVLRPSELSIGDVEVFLAVQRARVMWPMRRLALIRCDRFPYGRRTTPLDLTLTRISPAMPALEHLELSDDFGGPDDVVRAFETARPAFPALRAISLDTRLDVEVPLRRLVAVLPQLRAIAIRWPCTYGELDARKAELRAFHATYPAIALAITFEPYANGWLDDECFELSAS